MDPYRRQHFDWLLHEASADFVERVVHRCGGPQPALEALRADPQGEGVWLDQFVEAVFDEHLLGDAAGACFVLEALERRALPADPGGPVPEVLGRLARAAFAEVLAARAAQDLQRAQAFAG